MVDNFTSQHIAIIGGGASGIFTLCKLIDLKIDFDCLKPLKITLIEKRSALGEGMAYTLDHPSHLLNTASGLLSQIGSQNKFCLNNQPSFLKWLRENSTVWTPHYPSMTLAHISKNSYLPRGLVSLYLQNILKYYLKIAHHYQAHINIIHDEAINIFYQSSSELNIFLKNQISIFCHKIILALGGFLKEPFPFTEQEHYYANPWPNHHALKHLLKTQSIAIIGAKLSALDTLGILKQHHYQGNIYFLSRTGLLPTVKNHHIDYEPKLLHLTALQQLTKNFTQKLRLHDFMNLLKSELEHANEKPIAWNKILKQNRFNLAWLKWQIKLAHQPNTVWQSVLAAIDECVIIAWQNLDEEDKNKFVTSFSLFWETYRFSMPLEIAYQVWSMLANKQLTICSDLNTLSMTKHNQFMFTAIDCGNHQTITKSVDALINACGINYNLTTIHSTLIQNMIKNKMAIPHPYGGFCLKSPGYQLEHNDHIYVLGDLTKGTHFFTNSFLICSQQAAYVALNIFNELNISHCS